MFIYAFRSAKLGALYTAVTSLLAAIGLSLFWEGLGDGFLMLLIFWVPALAIAGLIIGYVLFLSVGFVVANMDSLKNMPVGSFTILGGLLSLFPLLVFCSEGAGIDPAAALAGNKGSYLVLIPGIIAASVAGAFVGQKI